MKIELAQKPRADIPGMSPYRPTNETTTTHVNQLRATTTGPCGGADADPRVIVRGRTASAGRTRGRAHVASAGPLTQPTPGAVLVCGALTTDLLPQLAYASAVVAERGGVLSIGATRCRELGIPLIVAAERATTLLLDGREVEVDADHGVVRARPIG